VYCYGDNFCIIFSQQLQTIDYLRNISWKPWFVSSFGNLIFIKILSWGISTVFSLISLSDIVITNKLSLVLQIICQCEIKHMMLQIKTITSVLKVLTCITTSIAAHPIRLTVIISVLTFKSAVILYISTHTYIHIYRIVFWKYCYHLSEPILNLFLHTLKIWRYSVVFFTVLWWIC